MICGCSSGRNVSSRRCRRCAARRRDPGGGVDPGQPVAGVVSAEAGDEDFAGERLSAGAEKLPRRGTASAVRRGCCRPPALTGVERHRLDGDPSNFPTEHPGQDLRDPVQARLGEEQRRLAQTASCVESAGWPRRVVKTGGGVASAGLLTGSPQWRGQRPAADQWRRRGRAALPGGDFRLSGRRDCGRPTRRRRRCRPSQGAGCRLERRRQRSERRPHGVPVGRQAQPGQRCPVAFTRQPTSSAARQPPASEASTG